jgi:hypothetical protein
MGRSEDQVKRRLTAMRNALEDAVVQGYEDLIPVMKNINSDINRVLDRLRSSVPDFVRAIELARGGEVQGAWIEIIQGDFQFDLSPPPCYSNSLRPCNSGRSLSNV